MWGIIMEANEIRKMNEIHIKAIYHLPSGDFLQFMHDHQEKTFDAWIIKNDGCKKLVASEDAKLISIADFENEVLNRYKK